MRNGSKKINRSEVTDKGLDLLPVLTEKESRVRPTLKCN